MINVLAYDNNVYLVNFDKNSECVYMVNIKFEIIQGYDNIHKIMRFGNYAAFDMKSLNKELKEGITKILIENNIIDKN